MNQTPLSRLPLGGRWLLGFALLQVVFFGLLVVGQAVPDRPIIDRLADSVRAGTYGPSSLPDRMGGIADSFTECVVVGTGLGAEPDASALARAVHMPRIGNCKGGSAQILQLESGESVVSSDYFKYWAGYTVIVRPLLATVGIEGVRVFSGAALLVGLVLAWAGLRRTTGWPVALALMGPVLLASNVMSTPSTAFSHAMSLAVLFAGVGCTALAARSRPSRGLAVVGLSAAAYCYIDLMTNPPLAWSLTVAAFALVMAARERRWQRVLGLTLGASAVWIAAFAATWASRWLIAAITLGPGYTIDVIRENVGFRTAGDNPTVLPGFGRAIGSNVQWWWERMPTAPYVLVVSLCIALAAVALGIWRDRRSAVLLTLVLAAPAVLPLLWFSVLNNHSQIHAFLAYRAVPGALGIIVAAGVGAAHLTGRRAATR